GIPAALRADADVESTVSGSRKPVRLAIRGGRLHAGSVARLRISVPDPDLDAKICETVCPEITFQEAGAGPSHPDVALLTIEEAMDLGRAIWTRPEETNNRT
ncbi:MAG: organomercurial lyase, partial [Methanobacteriota archaeon]